MSGYGPLLAAWGLGNYTSPELAGCLVNIERSLAVTLGGDRARLELRRELVWAEQDGRPLDEALGAIEAALEGLDPSHPARPGLQERLRVLLERKDKATAR